MALGGLISPPPLTRSVMDPYTTLMWYCPRNLMFCLTRRWLAFCFWRQPAIPQIANPCIPCIAFTAQWPLRRNLNANGKRQVCRSLVGQKFWSTHFVTFIVEHHVTEVRHCLTNVIFAFPHKREMSGVSFSEWYGINPRVYTMPMNITML